MDTSRDVGLVDGKRTFIPLENNPEVLAHLAYALGASTSLKFHDIYTLADLSHIPRPAHALIFICPSKTYYRSRSADTELKGHVSDDLDGVSQPDGSLDGVLWFKQTIGHACGLYSTVHALANGKARSFLTPGSTMAKIIDEATPLRVTERADLIYESKALEAAHREAARLGDTTAPALDQPNYHHFITFVKGTGGQLLELEGAWSGPIDRGQLGEDDDVLSEKALEMGVQKFFAKAEGDLDFSLVAITGEA